MRLFLLYTIVSYSRALLFQRSCLQPSRISSSPTHITGITFSRGGNNVKLIRIHSLRAACTIVASSSAASASTRSLMNSPISKQVIAVASMVLASITGCFNPSIIGGLLSGGLHAISGPDHLAALLPPSVGKPGWYGLKLGATWGLGHGVSAIFIGLCAYFLKGTMSTQFSILQRLSKYAEAAVGFSLLVIGAIGIKENMELQNEKNSSSSEDEIVGKMSMTTFKSSVSIFLNGILHGFSWDGAPSIAPALAMTSWRSALSFLLSYCIGKNCYKELSNCIFSDIFFFHFLVLLTSLLSSIS